MPGVRMSSEWLHSGGELGDLIRTLDWSSTPLGPRASWPQSLRTVVSLVVESRFPMALLWGRELILIYNDAYRVIAGDKHPRALGRSTREVWAEVWHINEPVLSAVLERGETLYFEDKPFPINRGGGREEATFTLSYSPVRLEDGTVGGAIVTLQETTARLAERTRTERERKRALDVLEHGDACTVLDSDFRYVLVNAAQEASSGKPRTETLGRRIWDVWPEAADQKLKFWEVYHRVMRERAPEIFEEYFAPLDLWVEVHVFPTLEGGIAAVSRRINERKQTEDALRASEERLRAAFDTLSMERAKLEAVIRALPLGVLTMDPGGRSITMNEAGLRLHNFGSQAEMLAQLGDIQKRFTLLHLDGRPVPPDEWPAAKALRGELVADSILRLRDTRLNTEKTVAYHVAGVRDSSGETALHVLVLQDITEATRSQEELRAAERQYRTLAEHTPEVIARFDRQFRHTYLNEYGVSVYGYRREEVIGKTNAELGMPADKVALWHHHFGAVLSSGEQRTVDFEFDSPTYGHQQFSSLFVPERDDNGEVASILAITRDVTTLRRAEQELMRERELLNQLIEKLPVMLTIYDPRQRSFRFNAEFRRVLGWTDEDAAVGNLMELAYPDTAMRAEASAHMARAEPGWQEFSVTTKDGSVVPSSWANVRLADHSQVGIGIDLRERKRAQEELAKSEAKFRALFENMPDAVFLTEPEGKILAANPAACAMFQMTEEECIRRGRDGLINHEDPRFEFFLKERRRTGRMANAELTFIRKNGEIFHGETSSVVTPGGHLRAFVIIRDVSDRKRAEEALREANDNLLQADRRKNEFLAVLSHELRNPLAPIRNSLYVLDRVSPGSEQAQRAKSILDRQVSQLGRLVEDLLDVTRISRGKITLRRERLDLLELTRRTAEDHRDELARNGIALAIETGPKSVFVHGDAARLAQVIGNLLHNCAKFTPPGGRTTVSFEVRDGQAFVRVRDTGVGIDPEILPLLFTPFMQAESTLDRTRGGLGLGLALVRGLVEMHGGEVRAHSDGPGRGSQFVITLPIMAEQQDSLAAADAASGSSPDRRVLIVEDNADAAGSLKDVLELLGHRVEVATTGQEAIDKARMHRPEVILCDIGLPIMDGYQVARIMRTLPETSGTHLVALSGYAQAEDIERSRAAGFDRHLAKPVDIKTLEALLADNPARPQGSGSREPGAAATS